jgi:hypothetical protein
MNKPNDDLNPAKAPAAAEDAPRRRQGRASQLAALGLILISALASAGLAYVLKSPTPQAKKDERRGKSIPAHLFPDWGRPDFVLVLSAQQEGYLLPCGCSYPQKGGLERRYNFIQLLKAEKGWPVAAVDLGDVFQKTAPAKLPNVQGLIKYRYSMMALKEMGYLAVGIGENEAGALAKIEGEWAANASQPAVLAANLVEAENKFPFLKPLETQIVPGTNIRIGVTNIIGPTVAKRIKDPEVKFLIPSVPSIREQLKKMRAENVDLPILLYHGLATGTEEAFRCAQAFPDFPILLALTEEDEPPANPISVDHNGGIRNYIFCLGRKGKSIGVLGVYRNGPNFRFKYQLVEMSEDYQTPPDEEARQPIMKLMEDYTRELKTKDYLKNYRQVEHVLQAMDPVPGLRNPAPSGQVAPTYIGSEKCKKCHEHAYAIWKASPHSHAYQTLVEAKHPSLRQYDGECIVCHTVGFGYKTGFTNEKETPHLENVGCESCHGPGSLHAKNPENQEWRERMNLPWRDARKKGNEQAKNKAIEQFCVTCHDIDNDVNWVHKKEQDPLTGKWVEKDIFFEKWVKGKIIHNNPPE